MRPVTTYDKIGVAVARGTRAQITEAGSQRGITHAGDHLSGDHPHPSEVGGEELLHDGVHHQSIMSVSRGSMRENV